MLLDREEKSPAMFVNTRITSIHALSNVDSGIALLRARVASGGEYPTSRFQEFHLPAERPLTRTSRVGMARSSGACSGEEIANSSGERLRHGEDVERCRG